MESDSGDGSDENDQWRFSLSDLEDEAADEETPAEEGAPAEETGGGNIMGSLQVGEELEAESISAENALFVVVGVLLAVAFVLGFVTLLP
jgi:hypothetical protein